jgi:hypothetical protein
LQRYQDQKLELTLDDGVRVSGYLLQSQRTGGSGGTSYDVIVRLAEGQLVAVHLDRVRDMRFPDLPEADHATTLRWLVHSAHSEQHEIELTYLTNGLQWEADYNACSWRATTGHFPSLRIR